MVQTSCNYVCMIETIKQWRRIVVFCVCIWKLLQSRQKTTLEVQGKKAHKIRWLQQTLVCPCDMLLLYSNRRMFWMLKPNLTDEQNIRHLELQSFINGVIMSAGDLFMCILTLLCAAIVVWGMNIEQGLVVNWNVDSYAENCKLTLSNLNLFHLIVWLPKRLFETVPFDEYDCLHLGRCAGNKSHSPIRVVTTFFLQLFMQRNHSIVSFAPRHLLLLLMVKQALLECLRYHMPYNLLHKRCHSWTVLINNSYDNQDTPLVRHLTRADHFINFTSVRLITRKESESQR